MPCKKDTPPVRKNKLIRSETVIEKEGVDTDGEAVVALCIIGDAFLELSELFSRMRFIYLLLLHFKRHLLYLEWTLR